MTTPITLSRRAFVAGSGLTIALALSPKAFAQTLNGAIAGAADVPALNAFVHVGTDGTVTVLSKHLEMGQGPYTGLATIVAEEMDADWGQMRTVASPADDKVYANLEFGIQGTGGSTSIKNSYEQLRKAGATARAMLVAAAADEWGVPAAEIVVEKGRVRHAATGRETGFGALADRAAQLALDGDVALKSPHDFTLIGTDRHRLDSVAKSTGKAIYTIDVRAEGMLTAMIVHPDHFGATVASFDDTAARAVPGVVDVKVVSQGVAVFAENTFAAMKGKAALKVAWDLSKAVTKSSGQIVADYRALFADAGLEAATTGDVEARLATPGVRIHEAELTFPFLAHAPMEPLDSVMVPAADGGIDIFAGSQFPAMDVGVTAKVCGVDPAKVRMNVQYAGGSFGRRAQFGSPFQHEAAEVFKASGMTRPVKLLWTREDDIRGGFYRPIYLHNIKAAIDADGDIVAWEQRIAGQSILDKGQKVDDTSVEGASDMPYAIPNRRVHGYNTTLAVPVLWWRSVGHTHTAFAVESVLDELLEMAGRDPVDGRLALLKESPRDAAVLQRAAEMADAAGPVPAGRARGVAVHKSFGTYVAEVVELSLAEGGRPRVHNVWVAVDCGVVINPNLVRAQMEGGAGFGLGAVLFDEITLGEGGRIVQSNFHDYRALRINEMPHVEVSIVASSEPPTGVGEPGVPPLGPAVANAFRRLTGQPVRRLPMLNGGVA